MTAYAFEHIHLRIAFLTGPEDVSIELLQRDPT